MNTPAPRQRTILGVDVERSTERNNVGRGQVREAMFDIVEKTLIASGITEELREPIVDRGDGAMVCVHPADQIPKPLLITTFVPILRAELRTQAFRLRVALHFGDVHYDARGPYGEDIDLMVRLLDAPRLRTQLSRTTEPLILAVSDAFHRSAVKHGYDGIDAGDFQPLLKFRMGGQNHRGWIQIPRRS